MSALLIAAYAAVSVPLVVRVYRRERARLVALEANEARIVLFLSNRTTRRYPS